MNSVGSGNDRAVHVCRLNRELAKEAAARRRAEGSQEHMERQLFRLQSLQSQSSGVTSPKPDLATPQSQVQCSCAVLVSVSFG